MMSQSFKRIFLSGVLLVSLGLAGTASAQELRYSWLDLQYMSQDVGDIAGTQDTPVAGQFVDIIAGDGNGVRFRGSFALGKYFYLFGDYGSTDIDVAAVVTNDQVVVDASDEFDLTTLRGGFGYRWSVGFSTDINFEIAYDSIDYDFGSFAGESFDTNSKEVGGGIGIRHMLSDNWEIRAQARYANGAELDLNTLEFDAGPLYGAGFSWELVRGFAIVGEYETGEVDSWSVGFRLDMDED